MPVRTCVITGASRGIGLATALRFAEQGCQIVAAARQEADLTAACRQIEAAGAKVHSVVVDVGQPDAARRLIDAAQQRFGRIDVLVNNAGRAPLAPLGKFDPAEFDRVLAVNVAAIFHTSQAVWPFMQAQHGGVIVNISSRAAVDPFPGFAVYGASKAWVNLFSQALADEGRPHNIRVFSVAPGAVETGLLRAAFPDFPREKTLAPDDVARVIVALCDESMAPSSGQTVSVRK
jgi:NAD(P)-dependent dehydrogenase (short-subunit alcohol dehydrogenase family)